ncbi:hypothetical protein ACHAXT_002120 [Thalassiosira profunda]
MSKIKMQVDAPQSPADPADPNFVDSLPDPLRSYAQEALAVEEGDSDEAAAGSINARLDQLEIATRSHLLELAEPLLAHPTGGGADAPLEALLRYLKDVTLLCLHVVQSHHGRLGAPAVKKLPFLLLEDAVDALPVGHVQSLWSSPQYPTLNVHGYTTTLLCSKHIFGPPSKLILLRICNKLLKVLSNRDVDAEFAGSLMLMTAKVFPLSERSAVNVLGSFNVANETIFEGEREFEEKSALSAGEKGGDGKIIGGSNIGYDFYKTFWGVQKVFTDPQGTVLPSRLGLSQAAAAAAYTGFVKDVTSILAALEGTPAPKTASSPLSTLDDASAPAGGDAVRHHKYLTSSQLLHLQLKDAKLRIHFLSQLIIVLSYLASPSVALPAPPVAAAAGADTAKLSAQIRSTQTKQLADVEKRAWQLLRATSPPMGESMHRSLRWLLRERESMWRGWKRGKCLPAQDKVGAVGVGGREVRKKLSGRKRKAEDGLDPTDGPRSRQDLAKSTVPALSDFLEPYVEALDPENGIEGEYHPRNDTVYSWRALRLLAQDQSETASGVGGHLSRFDKLRRCDGDFEGIVRGIWEENGEEIGGELPEDYYEDPGEEVAKEEEAKEAPDADMLDDVSVGSPVADEGATEEDEAAKKEKMAEFAKAAMDMDVELLDEGAGGSKEEEGGEEEESKVKIEDKAEADEKDIRDAAAETVMSMFDDEPKKKEAKKEPAAKGKAAAAKDEPTKAPRGKAKRGAKAQNGKKEQADSHWQEKRECPPSPGRAKFTPPPPKDQPLKGEDRPKNDPRDNSRGRYNHRRNNSDGHPPSDRRGAGDRQPERGRDGSADGRRGRPGPRQLGTSRWERRGAWARREGRGSRELSREGSGELSGGHRRGRV